MITLSNAVLVLPGRVIDPGTLIVEGGRIVEVVTGSRRPVGAGVRYDLSGHYVVPGFLDVHVHGVEGIDVHDGAFAVGEMAARLPRYGVTAFCPTTVACPPDDLRNVLSAVRAARENPSPRGARILPAHLESNFVRPEFAGAQPLACLRQPPRDPSDIRRRESSGDDDTFSAEEILRQIEQARPDVGIVTLAPELDGAAALIRRLAARGHLVSLGHSGATFDQALEAIAAGARHATHLFNRMTPLSHREPGLAGAVLHSAEVAVEIICDGLHVHPAMIALAVAAKTPSAVMAITDGTAGSGLREGSRARLAGRSISVRGPAVYLDDGTLAGSACTMDRVFATLVGRAGLSVVDAAALCSTSAASALGLQGHGIIAPGAVADLVVLDAHFRVVQTFVAGEPVLVPGESGDARGTSV